MSDRPHWIFAYGTLADPARVSAVIGRAYPDPGAAATHPTQLSGYRREQHTYYYATPDPMGRIDGVLIGPFSDQELARLDRYEGCPSLYTRESVAVSDPCCPREPATRTAWTYVGARIRDDHERAWGSRIEKTDA